MSRPTSFFSALLLLALFAAAWPGADTPGEKPKPKRIEEEEDDPPARPAKSKRVEEEDDAPRVKRSVLDISDTPPVGKGKAALPPPPPAPVIDLKRAAREARHPEARKLLARLAVPHDVVTLLASSIKVDGKSQPSGDRRVEPLAVYVGSAGDLKKSLEVTLIDAEGNQRGEMTIAPSRVSSVTYYEQIAEHEVREFLGRNLHAGTPDAPGYLSRREQLELAEQVLSSVVRFHRSAQAKGPRTGDAWAPVLTNLELALYEWQAAHLAEVVKEKQWGRAFQMAGDLMATYPDHGRLVAPVEALLAEAIRDKGLGLERFRQERQVLRARAEAMTERRSALLSKIEKSLEDEASALLKRANDLHKNKGDERTVQDLYRQAEELWPSLRGLHTGRVVPVVGTGVLRVGVRHLPQFVSPARAATDPEWWALDLVFEGLVRFSPDTDGFLHPRPALAQGRPRVVSLGREFTLPRHLAWSDGKPFSANDLRKTVSDLQGGKGRAADWAQVLNKVRIGGDSTRVTVELQHGALDPLARMNFHVLPGRPGLDVTGDDFAKAPVGTGPYRFVGLRQEPRLKNKTVAAFEANRHYAERADRLGLPRIREILFVPSADPVKELAAREIDLALDLTAGQANELRSRAEVVVTGAKGANRRIYFLAVNHRSLALKRPAMRLALLRAIDRETLLDAHFREPIGKTIHKALNGPFPIGSWASDPGLATGRVAGSPDPFDADLARTKLRQAKAEGGLIGLKLTLKYPSGDPALSRAMEALCEGVKKELGVELIAEPRDPQVLRDEVEGDRGRPRYDLAYYWHDFADDTYDLAPLLGQNNYLGFDGAFARAVAEAGRRRYFARVQTEAHALHREFLSSAAPFIPLWQLDSLAAWRSGELEPTPFDGHRPFVDVERWRIPKK